MAVRNTAAAQALGLTIVRELVERHRGQIWLASTAGEGSTFFFTLSAADDSQHA